MDRVKKLTEALRMLIGGEFTGYIKINFSQGNIGRVEKFEEFDDAAIARSVYRSGKKEEDVYDGNM